MTSQTGTVLGQLIDFNGDGLADYVAATGTFDGRCTIDLNGDGSQLLYAGCLSVYFNTGQGFRTEPLRLPSTAP